MATSIFPQSTNELPPGAIAPFGASQNRIYQKPSSQLPPKVVALVEDLLRSYRLKVSSEPLVRSKKRDTPHTQVVFRQYHPYRVQEREFSAVSSRASPRETVYVCTVHNCKEPCKRKSDWKRHEKAKHERLEEWVCPELECRNKPFGDASFFRRHHQNVHGCQQCNHAAAARQHRMSKTFWGCGFCPSGKLLTGWDARCNHIAAHYEGKLSVKPSERSEWSYSAVVNSLLKQPAVAEAWDELLAKRLGPDMQYWPYLTWPADDEYISEIVGQLQCGPTTGLYHLLLALLELVMWYSRPNPQARSRDSTPEFQAQTRNGTPESQTQSRNGTPESQTQSRNDIPDVQARYRDDRPDESFFDPYYECVFELEPQTRDMYALEATIDERTGYEELDDVFLGSGEEEGHEQEQHYGDQSKEGYTGEVSETIDLSDFLHLDMFE
jgi:hypothetical protein